MSLDTRMILIGCRMPIRPSLREFRTFVVSSSPSTTPSLPALRTPIFQHGPSSPHSHPCPPSSAHGLIQPNPLPCKAGNCCHGQRHLWNGLDTLGRSFALIGPRMGVTLSVDPVTTPFESGMPRLVL